MKTVLIALTLFAFSSIAFAQTDRDQAISLYRAGEYKQAIEIFERLRANSEADYPAATYLGAAYVKIGNNEKALEVFRNMRTVEKPAASLNYDRKVKITNSPRATLSEEELRRTGGGTVHLAVELKEDGTIGFVLPFVVTSEKLIGTAVKAAQGVKFKPAIFNGEPVSVVMVLEYEFQSF